MIEDLKLTKKEQDDLLIISKKEYNDIKTEFLPFIRSLNIARYKDDFSTVAKESQKEAYIWLGALIFSTIVLSIFLGCFILSGFEFQNINSTVEKNAELFGKGLGKTLFYLEIAKAIFYRLIVLSICTFIIKICYSNYKAAKHNVIINKHKDNSMKGALGLINSASDEKVKDQILQLAANAVFAHQASGYNDKEVDSNNYSSIVDKVAGKVADKL